MITKLLRNRAASEDVVQETFVAFLRSLNDYRGQAGIETYLFTILRRNIINHLRGRRLNVCRIQDTSGFSSGARQGMQQIPAADPTASWYARRDENRDIQRRALAEAIRDLIDSCKASGNLRNLEVIELVFYCQLRNKDIAGIAGVSENQVALIKHRSLNRVREHVAKALPTEQLSLASDALLTEIWETHRLSCPKRSTIGAYLLGTLEPPWRRYVDFHLNKLGCRFCLANLEDIQRQSAGPQKRLVHDRIMQSTVGFLSHT